MADKKLLQIVGGGCAKCKKLLDQTETVVNELGKGDEYTIEYVTDVEKFSDLNVFITPALLINGKIVASGRLPDNNKIKELLLEHE